MSCGKLNCYCDGSCLKDKPCYTKPYWMCSPYQHTQICRKPVALDPAEFHDPVLLQSYIKALQKRLNELKGIK
jgi:hypothetical protein